MKKTIIFAIFVLIFLIGCSNLDNQKTSEILLESADKLQEISSCSHEITTLVDSCQYEATIHSSKAKDVCNNALKKTQLCKSKISSYKLFLIEYEEELKKIDHYYEEKFTIDKLSNLLTKQESILKLLLLVYHE